jgi:hypothetical protein
LFHLDVSPTLGGVDLSEKQKLLDSIDKQLQSIGATDEERQEVARPYLNFIAYDLYVIFYRTTKSAIQRHVQKSTNALVDWDKKFMPVGVTAVEPFFNNGKQLTAYLRSQVDRSIVDQDDYGQLTGLADRMGEIFEGCIKRRGYTDDYISLLNSNVQK